MNDRLIHLRIKIKTFAAEAVIIRQEAQKVSGTSKWGLNAHRTGILREHARYNLLAYGLLKGLKYEVMEKKCDQPPNFKKVAEVAERFGGVKEDIEKWITEAKAYCMEANKFPSYRLVM
jgi:hypothetical protein